MFRVKIVFVKVLDMNLCSYSQVWSVELSSLLAAVSVDLCHSSWSSYVLLAPLDVWVNVLNLISSLAKHTQYSKPMFSILIKVKKFNM